MGNGHRKADRQNIGSRHGADEGIAAIEGLRRIAEDDILIVCYGTVRERVQPLIHKLWEKVSAGVFNADLCAMCADFIPWQTDNTFDEGEMLKA
jgi:hypothetical protein